MVMVMVMWPFVMVMPRMRAKGHLDVRSCTHVLPPMVGFGNTASSQELFTIHAYVVADLPSSFFICVQSLPDRLVIFVFCFVETPRSRRNMSVSIKYCCDLVDFLYVYIYISCRVSIACFIACFIALFLFLS